VAYRFTIDAQNAAEKARQELTPSLH